MSNNGKKNKQTVNSEELEERRKKNAERARAFRLKKKIEKAQFSPLTAARTQPPPKQRKLENGAQQIFVQGTRDSVIKIEYDTSDPGSISQDLLQEKMRKRLLNLERCRKYRQRRRQHQLEPFEDMNRYEELKIRKENSENISSISIGGFPSVLTGKLRKKQLNCRKDREKRKISSQDSQNLLKNSGNKLTNATVKQKNSNSQNVIIPALKNDLLGIQSEMDAYMTNMTIYQSTTSTSPVGEFCSAICKLANEKKIVVSSINIKTGQKISDIIDFVDYHLAPFAMSSSKNFKSTQNYCQFPMILSGDFTIDFTKAESIQVINHMSEFFDLRMAIDNTAPTTENNTPIKTAVFTRYILEN